MERDHLPLLPLWDDSPGDSAGGSAAAPLQHQWTLAAASRRHYRFASDGWSDERSIPFLDPRSHYTKKKLGSFGDDDTQKKFCNSTCIWCFCSEDMRFDYTGPCFGKPLMVSIGIGHRLTTVSQFLIAIKGNSIWSGVSSLPNTSFSLVVSMICSEHLSDYDPNLVMILM